MTPAQMFQQLQESTQRLVDSASKKTRPPQLERPPSPVPNIMAPKPGPRRNPHREGRDMKVYNEDTLASLAAGGTHLRLEMPGEDSREDEKQAEVKISEPPSPASLNPNFNSVKFELPKPADPSFETDQRAPRIQPITNFNATAPHPKDPEGLISLGPYDRSDVQVGLPLSVKAENLGVPRLQPKSEIGNDDDSDETQAFAPGPPSPQHDLPDPQHTVVQSEAAYDANFGEKPTYMSFVAPIVVGIFLISWAVTIQK